MKIRKLPKATLGSVQRQTLSPYTFKSSAEKKPYYDVEQEILDSDRKADYYDLEFGSGSSISTQTIPLIVISSLKICVHYENASKNIFV